MSKCKNCDIIFATYGEPNAEYCSDRCKAHEPMIFKMNRYEAIILDHVTSESSYEEIKDACRKCAFHNKTDDCIRSQNILGECAPNKTIDGFKTIFKKVDERKYDYRRLKRS